MRGKRLWHKTLEAEKSFRLCGIIGGKWAKEVIRAGRDGARLKRAKLAFIG